MLVEHHDNGYTQDNEVEPDEYYEDSYSNLDVNKGAVNHHGIGDVSSKGDASGNSGIQVGTRPIMSL